MISKVPISVRVWEQRIDIRKISLLEIGVCGCFPTKQRIMRRGERLEPKLSYFQVMIPDKIVNPIHNYDFLKTQLDSRVKRI